MALDLSKLGLKPVVKYYYHPESEAYLTLGINEQPDPHLVEITKAEYDEGLTKQKASALQAQSAIAAEAVSPTQIEQTHVQGQPVAAPSATSLILRPGNGQPVGVDSILDGKDPKTFGPADLDLRLKSLDDLITSSAGLSQLQIDTARKYVMDIMICLRVNPEFDSILVDKDVHNVMTFVQSSITMAQADFVQKKEKKSKAAAKAAGQPKLTFDTSLFDNLGNPGVKALPKGNVTFDLTAFGSMNTDDIDSKDKK